jgi:hypothetical protein
VLRDNQDKAAFSLSEAVQPAPGDAGPFGLNLGRCLTIAALKTLAVPTDAMIAPAIRGGPRLGQLIDRQKIAGAPDRIVTWAICHRSSRRYPARGRHGPFPDLLAHGAHGAHEVASGPAQIYNPTSCPETSV